MQKHLFQIRLMRLQFDQFDIELTQRVDDTNEAQATSVHFRVIVFDSIDRHASLEAEIGLRDEFRIAATVKRMEPSSICSSACAYHRQSTAMVEDANARAERLHLFHVVAGVNNRQSRCVQLADALENVVPRLRIDARRGLVERSRRGRWTIPRPN